MNFDFIKERKRGFDVPRMIRVPTTSGLFNLNSYINFSYYGCLGSGAAVPRVVREWTDDPCPHGLPGSIPGCGAFPLIFNNFPEAVI